MFDIFERLIGKFSFVTHTAVAEPALARAAVIGLASRSTSAHDGLYASPRLTCRWVHDPMRDRMTCIWGADDSAQDPGLAEAA
jgi:hypothetical protein